MGSDAPLVSNLSFSEPDFYLAALKTFSVLAIILALILVGFYLIRRFGLIRSAGAVGTRWVTLINTTPIAPKKMIGVVDVAGEILVVGLTEQQISLLTKVTDEQVIAHLRKNQGGRSSEIPFYQQFKSLLGTNTDMVGDERQKDQTLLGTVVDNRCGLTQTPDSITAPGSRI